MRIGDHRQESRDKGQGDEGDENAFDPEPARGPTAIIGRALVLHSAFRRRSLTDNRILAIRRFTAGKVCFGSNVTAVISASAFSKRLAMVLELTDAVQRVLHQVRRPGGKTPGF